MTDVLGWRRKFGVIGPSTNTVVHPDFDDMRPPGVTNHYSRIFTPNADAVSNDSFRAARQIESISTSSCSEFSRDEVAAGGWRAGRAISELDDDL
jgi:maleate cis-trans isomerase